MEKEEIKASMQKAFAKYVSLVNEFNKSEQAKVDKFNILFNYTQFLAKKLGIEDIELN